MQCYTRTFPALSIHVSRAHDKIREEGENMAMQEIFCPVVLSKIECTIIMEKEQVDISSFNKQATHSHGEGYNIYRCSLSIHVFWKGICGMQ